MPQHLQHVSVYYGMKYNKHHFASHFMVWREMCIVSFDDRSKPYPELIPKARP